MGKVIDIELKELEGISVLKLKGMITEESDLSGFSQISSAKVIIDMEGVERINSYGIRQWINALKDLTEKSEELVFTKCPPIIVEQFNMISNFGASGKVLSFYLPFYSEDKDDEKLILFAVNELEGSLGDPEELVEQIKSKDSSLEDYEFNDLEDEYFAFMSGENNYQFSEEIVRISKRGIDFKGYELNEERRKFNRIKLKPKYKVKAKVKVLGRDSIYYFEVADMSLGGLKFEKELSKDDVKFASGDKVEILVYRKNLSLRLSAKIVMQGEASDSSYRAQITGIDQEGRIVLADFLKAMTEAK